MRLAIAGLAHPHVTTVLTEVDHWPDVQLVAMSDPDPALIERYGSPFADTRTYADHRVMLDRERIDVVAVAARYGDRGAIVVDALNAGCQVLADKPLCTTGEQLDAIRVAAESAGRTVSVLFEKRFYPATLAARKLIAAGDLGEIVEIASTGPHRLNRPTRPDWFFDRRQYGGILVDLATHDLDLALLFTGATSGWISAVAGRSAVGGAEFPDHAAALLRLGEAVATIEVDWLTPGGSPYHGDYRMRLTGTRGTAEIAFARSTVTVVTTDAGPHELELPPGRRPAEEPIEALLAGRTPEVDTAAGIRATHLALLAQASAAVDGERFRWDFGPARLGADADRTA